MHYTPWLERKFNFDFPISNFPFTASRLSGTLPRIEALVKDVSESELTKKPNGKWSIKEHIGHLSDLEELNDGRIDDFKNKLLSLRAADLTNNKTMEADHNKTSIKELISRFSQTRNYFIIRLRSLSETELSRSALHPRLQKQMRPVDMAFFIAEHDDHHLTIMEEIVKGSDI